MNLWRFISAFIYLTLPLQIGLFMIIGYFLELKIKGLIKWLRQ